MEGGSHDEIRATKWFTMNIKMKPGSILVRVGGPVEEHDLAFVPALVRLADLG